VQKDKHLFLQSCKGKYPFIGSSSLLVMLQKRLKNGQLYKRIVKELFSFSTSFGGQGTLKTATNQN
jgi:hypothetical protein